MCPQIHFPSVDISQLRGCWWNQIPFFSCQLQYYAISHCSQVKLKKATFFLKKVNSFLPQLMLVECSLRTKSNVYLVNITIGMWGMEQLILEQIVLKSVHDKRSIFVQIQSINQDQIQKLNMFSLLPFLKKFVKGIREIFFCIRKATLIRKAMRVS